MVAWQSIRNSWAVLLMLEGERVGGIPYGHRDEGGRLVEGKAEQTVVRRARNLRAGGLSFCAISRQLQEGGHEPRKAKRWHVQVVRRMVDATVSDG